MDPKSFGDWTVIRSLGKGGQGEVFLGRRLTNEWYERARSMLKNASAGVMRNDRIDVSGRAVNTLDQEVFSVFNDFAFAPLGAVKVLHASDKLKNPRTGRARFEREIEALKTVSHPALVRILDSDENGEWFVMEYHDGGTLSKRLTSFRGNVYRAIVAIRPIIDAVAQLHNNEIVHRDIKPDNIQAANDGRLILGDLGISFGAQKGEERVTSTHESVGSRDWMPTWAQGPRLHDVPPCFDVFGLGKVLWAMVAAKGYLRLHYFREDEFSLEKMFPHDRSMSILNSFLDKCVVERKGEGFGSAVEMLQEIDLLEKEIARLLVEDFGDKLLPAKLFPGAWRLTFHGHANGEEDFAIGEGGAYVVDGTPRFETRAVQRGKLEIILRKRRPDGTREFIEHLYSDGNRTWRGADQYGNQLVYERQVAGQPARSTSSDVSLIGFDAASARRQ